MRPSPIVFLAIAWWIAGTTAGGQSPTTRRVPQSYRTIQSAIDAARVGDTVLIDHGLYYENVRIAKNIVVGSRYLVDGDTSHIAQTVLDGSRARDARNASVIAIRAPGGPQSPAVIGLTIQGGRGSWIKWPFDGTEGFCGGGILVLSNGAEIRHNRIIDNHISAGPEVEWVGGAGLYACDLTSPPPRYPFIVRSNFVAQNSVLGASAFGPGINVEGPSLIEGNVALKNRCTPTVHYGVGGGILATSELPDTIRVYRNLSAWNVSQRAAGIGISGNEVRRSVIGEAVNNIIRENVATERGAGFATWYVRDVVLINNTIIQNRAGAYGGGVDASYGMLSLMNNIIVSNQPFVQISYNELLPASNNLIENGFPGFANISGDPELLDDATIPRLMRGSPAVGAGADSMISFGRTIRAPGIDFDGAPRRIAGKSAPDLGAVESRFLLSNVPETESITKLSVTIRPLTDRQVHVDPHSGYFHTTEVAFVLNDTVDLGSGEEIPTVVLDRYDRPLQVECYVAPNNTPVGYRTILDGRDFSWTLRSRTELIGYSGLEPGTYTFRIQSKRSSHDYPWVESSIRISVPFPWWQTWWALGSYSLFVAGVSIGLYQSRIRRRRMVDQARADHLMLERLSEVDRLKSQFFANISHELRTPLTLIQGPADDLLAKVTDPSDRERLSLIRRHSDRLLRLIDQLLQFTRVEAGTIPLEVAHQEIVCILRRACDAFSSRATRKGLTLRFTSTKPECHGWIDAQKLEQIVENLVSNAVKFTPSGGRINVLARCDHGELTVVVEDTGPGIAPEHLPHVFERFYRADKTHKVEGTGIGLSLAKELVELHRGRIRIDSQVDIGTTVSLTVPLEGYLKSEMAESSPTPPTSHIPMLGPSAVEDLESSRASPVVGLHGDRPLILVVEDNDDARAFIGSRLREQYDVELSSSGREALGIAQHVVPDLVISDVMMPGMDGYELCRALKTDERTSHIPVILLTALADRGDRIEGLEHGADEYLTKPFDGEELRLRIRNLLHQRDEVQKRHRTVVTLAPSMAQPRSLEDAFLQKVNASVREHLADEQYSIEDLARDVALSRTQVYRKLKALTNLSPIEYIRRLRLERAKELLEAHAGTISEVAYQTGFSNASWFAKCYREEFGMLPSDARKRENGAEK